MVSTRSTDSVAEPALVPPRGTMGPSLLGSEDSRIGPRQMILRSEFIRLLEQALESLGYPELAVRLEQESVGGPWHRKVYGVSLAHWERSDLRIGLFLIALVMYVTLS